DGNTIAIFIKPESATVYNLALIDWRTHAVRYLTNETTEDHNWSFVAWSPDGKTVYANRGEISFTDADVYRIDVATEKTRNLTPHEGKVVSNATSLSPDGRTLLVTSNAKNGYKNVALLDVATGKRTWVTEDKWEAGSQDMCAVDSEFKYHIITYI